MSAGDGAGAVLSRAVAAWLRAAPALAGVAVFDAAPPRVGTPYLVVDDPVLGDWSAKDWTGREGRLAVIALDAGDSPARVRALAAAAEDAVAAMAPDLGDGWRLAGLVLATARVARTGTGWRGSVEWRVRMWRQS